MISKVKNHGLIVSWNVIDYQCIQKLKAVKECQKNMKINLFPFTKKRIILKWDCSDYGWNIWCQGLNLTYA